MDRTHWQNRLRALGLTQGELARAIGMTAGNLSNGLRGQWKSGVPGSLTALIVALELLPADRRREWVELAYSARQGA